MAEGIRVLCVDDESTLLEAGKRFLERKGDIVVDTALSAAGALDLLSKKQYDAIVADYMMPEMDGIELLKKVRALNKGTPFILFTGRGREDVVINALNHGADFYIQKNSAANTVYTELGQIIRQAVASRKTQMTVAEQEQRSQDIQNANDLIQTIAPDGRFLFVNKKWQEVLGYTEEDLRERTIYTIIHKNSLRQSTITFQRLLSGETPGILDLILRAKDGRMVHVEGIAACRFSGGEPQYIRGVFRDVTDKKEIERGLYESENKFATIFKRNPVPLALVAASDGVFVDVNDAFLNNTGYAREEVIGKTAAELALFADETEYRRMMSELREKRAVKGMEIRCRVKSGEIRSCRFTSSVVITDTEPHILSTIEDITEYKQSETALHESGERYRLILEHAHDGILINELTSRGPGKFLDVNNEACRILGMTREEMQGICLVDLDTAEMHERASGLIREIMEKRHSVFQTRYVTKDNREKILDISVSLFDLNGRPTMLSIVRDITEQKAEESARLALVTGMVGTTGRESLDRIARSLSTWLLADCVMIGEILPDNDNIRVLSMLLDGKPVQGYSYRIRGSPCENAAEKGFCIYPDDVARLFPESSDLKKFNIRGYIGTPLRNSEGRVVGILCILTRKPVSLPSSGRYVIDIIAAKAAAEISRIDAVRALTESEQKFRSVFVNSPYPITINSIPDNCFCDVNAAFLNASGYTHAEVLGKNPVELGMISPADATRIMSQRHINGRIENLPLALTVKDGTRVHVQFSTMPVLINDRPAVVTVTAEVTKMKRVEEDLLIKNGMLIEIEKELRKNYEDLLRNEQELIRSERRYHSLFENMLDGFVYCRMVSDSSGNPCDAVILETNRAFHRLLGFENVTGKRATDLIPDLPEKNPELFALLGRVAVSGIPETAEIHVIPLEKWLRITVYSPEKGFFIAVFEDFTDRKSAEDALEKSEKIFRNIFSGSALGLTLMHPDFRVLLVNPSLAAMLGYTEEEMTTLSLADISHPDDSAADSGRFAELTDGTIPVYRAEKRFVRKDKSIMWGSLNATVVRGDSGEIIHYIAQIEDITARKRAEEALKRSEEKYRSLAEVSKDLIIVIDRNDSVEYVNSHAAAMLGKAAEEIVGKHRSVLFPAGPDHRQKDRIREVFETGRIVRSEGELMVGQNLHWYDHHLIPVTDAGDSITSVLWVSRDITTRKSMENDLKKSEEMLGLVMNSVPTLLSYLDAELRFVYVNKQHSVWFGCSQEDLIGKCLSELFPEDLFSLAVPEIQKALGGAEVTYEATVQDHDAREHVLNVHLTPHTRNGQVTGIFAAVNDVTEHRRTEEALRQANKKLSLLSGITRHDIKNQLLTLDSFIVLLHSRVSDPLLEHYFTRITAASRRIAGMIQFTKDYEQVGIRAPVWQELRSLADAAAQKAMPGEVTVDNSVPAGSEIFADPLISTVFFNLVDNSLRHGDGITRIRFALEARDGNRIIVCEDDGKGVVPEEKERIFEHGFGRNTGFGLSIARDILEITGMTIRETGEHGYGARFEIVVPKGLVRSDGDLPQ